MYIIYSLTVCYVNLNMTQSRNTSMFQENLDAVTKPKKIISFYLLNIKAVFLAFYIIKTRRLPRKEIEV